MSDTVYNWSDELEDELTDKQKAILETAVENPEYSAAEIAVETDSSASYVRDVRSEYEDRLEVTEESSDSGSGFIILLLILAVLWYAYSNGMIPS